MTKKRVYVETTVVSYLTAWPSRDVVIAGHQQVTRDWWDIQRGNYELCASQLVRQEAGCGDPTAAQARIEILDQMTLFEITPSATDLAKILIARGALPMKASADALHVGIAAVEKVPYLLTWNCRHLANATMRPLIETVCTECGLQAPIICTPEELTEVRP